MSAYTPKLVRDYIDCMDAVVREGLENGTMGRDYDRERIELVSELTTNLSLKIY
jgi:hypothetical protein